jgi:multidrug efflux pump subunit AcrA (membrane-fusion protein)
VVVEGQGGYEIATSVSVDNIPSVSVGQDATVTPDGSHQTLTGKVVAISLVPATTTTTSTLYHVIVGLTNPGASLHDGATGTVAILTKHTRAALAVPTSAVTTTRNRHTVTVLENGTPTVVPVQVGAIGATWTEIKSGLSAGQQVVLADVFAPLPGSATASSSSTTGTSPFGGAGRFGGLGGGVGGGFGGGGTGRTGTRGG